jgi:hypothetical protein
MTDILGGFLSTNTLTGENDVRRRGGVRLFQKAMGEGHGVGV